MNDLQTILTQVVGLSEADRAKVRSALSALASEPVAGKVTDAMATVWPGFVDRAKVRGINLPPMSIIARHKAYPKLKEGAATLVEFAEAFEPKSKLERQAAIDFCIEALLRWITDRIPNAPTSVRIIAQQIAYVGDAVDAQLPGYQAAGLLHVVLRGLKKAKSPV